MPANFFKSRRLKLDKTQREIAIAIGVTETTIGNWEKFNTHPDLSLVGKLAEVYAVTEPQIEQAILTSSRVMNARQPIVAK